MFKLFGLNRLFERGGDEGDADAKPREPVPSRPRLKPNPGTTILIIDDSKTTQVVLARMLNAQGYQTVAAYDGESGLELAREHRPAAIFMDVVMPGITGFQATRNLRKDPDPHLAHTPVIIMSGNQQATEQFFSVKIGANEFMLKPFAEDDVFSRLERLLYPSAHNDSDQEESSTPIGAS